MRIWHAEVPNQQHAAEWLLWLHKRRPEAWDGALVASTSRTHWPQTAPSEIRFIYDAANADGALDLLDAWLWLIPDDRFSTLAEFPQAIPGDLRQRARNYWRDRAAAFTKEVWQEVNRAPHSTCAQAASCSRSWRVLSAPTSALTHERMTRLSEYLTWTEQNELYQCLAPSEPSQMPIQPGLVLRWFHDEYLPYRLWQCMNNIQVAQPHVDKLAHQFAVWYLELYPKALMGQAMHARLSFIRNSRP